MKQVWSIFCLALLALFLLSACTDDRIAQPLLDRAEALLPAQPDSAEVCLNRIPNPVRLSEANGARYGLLRSMTDDRLGKGVGSDTLIRDSHEYYRKASHAGQTDDPALLRRYAQSCYYMSLFYSSCDSTKQCEDLLHQAIKSSEKCEDWHTCYLAYTMLSKSTCWSNPEYAIQQAQKALGTYYKINDDVNNEVLILDHIGSAYLTYTEPDSALKYFLKGNLLAKKNNLLESYNVTCMGIAETYLYMEEYEKALQYAKLGFVATNDSSTILSPLTLARCYQACDSLEEAKKLYTSIEYDDSHSMTKYLVFKGLSEIAIQQKDMESLTSFTDSVHESLEDRFLQSQRIKDEYYKSNIAKEIQKEKIQREAERSKWILGFIIFFIILLALYIYNVLRNRYVLERQKHLNHVLTQRYEHARLLQEQQEKERVIATREKEIQYQKEIIHQKVLTISLLQKHLLEKLEHISQSLSENEKVKMTEEAWAEIEQLLNDTDNHFVQELRNQHKNFKEEDIQLCMLIRLKMSNTIISNIYHIGVPAVKKRKMNLKKMRFNITDPNISIEQVIENL
ncbi:MAG: hypothetical protein IJ693_00510 [Bacteroidaceae bacterium]|nr:hypothetical protein [Bacteroidaceae bacterium]